MSFASPVVTIARGLTNSFSGIAPADVPMLIVAQLGGALAGLGVMRWFFIASPAHAPARLRIGWPWFDNFDNHGNSP